MKIETNKNLKMLTSWQVGGPAEFYAEPSTVDELREAVSWATSGEQPITIFSGGSNVLVHDEGIRGLTICLRSFKNLSPVESSTEHILDCDPGVPKAELLRFFLKRKSPAALFLAGIPGDVGGGVIMNAGVSESLQPREFCEIVREIDVLDPESLKIKTILSSDLDWRYRHCEGWKPGILTRVRIAYSHAEDPQIGLRTREANLNRLKRQPLDQPSCGSVFRNPPGQKAAVLIDSAGLKGYSRGEVQVSTKHANFITHDGRGTASDIDAVIEHVRKVVASRFQVNLQTEVVYLGQWEKQSSPSFRVSV